MYYKVHGIMNLKSDIPIFPKSFLSKIDMEKIHLEVTIKDTDFFIQQDENKIEIMPGIYTDKAQNKLHSVFSILGLKCFLTVEGLKEPFPLIVNMNKNFYKFTNYVLRMPVASMFPLEHFLKLVFAHCLQRQKARLIFCAGFKLYEKTILVASYGSMGKTTLLLDLANKFGSAFELLGDDTCILKDGMVYPYPQNVRVRSFGWKFFHFERFVSPDFIFPKITHSKFEPKFLFFLERSSTFSIEQLCPDVAKKKFNALQTKILPIGYERITSSLSYLDEQVDAFPTGDDEWNFVEQCSSRVIRGKRKDYVGAIFHSLSI